MAGTALGLVALCALLPRCSNGATAVDECRTIEQARCQAVQGCPGSPVVEDSDVNDCQLFYRDECLFGMADSMSPDPTVVDACVNAINGARTCWAAGLSLGQCAAGDAGVQGPALVSGANPALSGCDAIMSPEILEACSFLSPPPAATPDAAGGGSGGGGGAGGTSAGGADGG
jgi:hypothetical protein